MSKAFYSGIVDADDVERSSTLTKRDIGKHVVVANGCMYLRDTEKAAHELVKAINE